MTHLPMLISGVLWLAAACVLVEVARLLGPTFHTKRTAHAVWRFLTWAAAVAFFAWGVLQLFPGRVQVVTQASAFSPIPSLAVLGVSLALLDWVMRDRAPPPWSVQILRLVALLGRDGPVRYAAMAVPPAAAGDALPREERGRSRLPVLIGAVLMVAAVALFLALNSPVSAPH